MKIKKPIKLLLFSICIFSCVLDAAPSRVENSMSQVLLNYHKVYFDENESHRQLMDFFIPRLLVEYENIDFNERFLPYSLVWTLRGPVEIRKLDNVREEECDLDAARKIHFQGDTLGCLIVSGENEQGVHRSNTIIFTLLDDRWLISGLTIN
jgi:hypothetical protein